MSIAVWSIDARKAFGLYVTFNSFLGLWPLIRVDLRLKIRMTIAVIELIIMTSCTFYEMIRNCGDAEDSLDSLLVIASALISLSKLILYHVHREKLTVNVISAIRDWSSIESIDHRSVMESYRSVYKKIGIFLGVSVLSCGILHFLNVQVFRPNKLMEAAIGGAPNGTRSVLKKRYLFPSTCTLNNVSETLHFIIVSNQFVQMVTCCVVAIGSDAFFLAITAHLCGQFEILRKKFADFGSDWSLSTATASREKINALISRHQHLLTLAELVEGSYNKIVLIQLMTSITLISVGGFGFVIALKTSDFFASVKSFMVIQYMLLQAFMYTCIGEALQNGGENIMNSVYDGSWYELPHQLSKDLVLVMLRSNVLPRLTAGKFFDMTRATFMDVVKISFSYLSALQLMLDE